MRSWDASVERVLRALRLGSVRRKIFVFAVLATLIPALSTTWLSYTENRRSLTEKIRQELGAASAQAARELDLWIKERVYELRVFASSYEVSENLERLNRGGASGSARRLREYLSSVRDRFKDYEELLVVDLEARVAATSGETRSAKLPPTWLAEIRRDNAVLGDPYWDAESQRALMALAAPVYGAQGRLLGALTARLDLRTIGAALTDFAPDTSAHLYLVGRDGALLASSRPAGLAPLRERLGATTTRTLLGRRGRVVEYTGITGVEVVGTAERVPGLEWAVVVDVPAEEAFRQIVRLRNVTVLVLAGLLAGVGLLAYLLGLLIVNPLNRLRAGAAQVALGDLAVDLPDVAAGEVGYLTRVFNDMVARLRESRAQLEKLSVTDALTGLYNRRHLIEALEAEVRRSERHGHRFAVLMADIDYFKEYNDRFGHLAGDRVLRRVASILRETMRDVDCVARFGGEEFIVLMPETDAETALDVAERIRMRMGKEVFEGGRVTVSVGVAAFPEHGGVPDALIAAADDALYRAKHDGRDRVAGATGRRAKG